MTKEELTEDIIRRLGLRSFLLNEINSFLKCSTHIPKLENADYRFWDMYYDSSGITTNTWRNIKLKP